MTCCAIGPCGDPGCYLCATVAKLPQPVFKDRPWKAPKHPDVRDGEASPEARRLALEKSARRLL